jgi:glycosyltransferase involved in cell wall biosynthesis
VELNLIRSQDNHIIKRYDTGVILHLYYPDMWNDMLPYLLNLGKQFDLFVTIPYDVDISENTIKENFPNAQIYHCENRGRDIAPFLVVFSAIAKLGYKYICKIHTKKSPHIPNGIEWQQDMLRKLLGSRKLIPQIKKAFDKHPDWGLIAPQGHVAPNNYFWGPNATNVIKLAHSVGIPTDNIEFSYVAGSMFWFRPQAFNLLLEKGILAQDFDLEQGQQDGTLAHAFERFFGMATNYAGYKIAESDSQEVKLSDISFQFRILIQAFQNQEQIFTAQVMEKERSVLALTVQAAALTAQVAEKEQAVAALTAQVAEKEQAVAALTAQVAEIQGSRAWRLIQVLWKIRTAIVPHGSRRERWLYLAVRAASYFKHYGLRSFIRRAVEKLKHKGVTSLISPQPDPFAVIAQDGRPCPMPAISIVIEKNHELNLPSVSEADVLAWVSAQTLRGIEVAVWESDTDKAFTLGESVRTWDAPGLEGLCGGLAGRYLCMASPDLLQRNRAYLETNLITLESEGLAFTVNALGRSDWLLAPLVRNHLPGDRRLPYLRQVIRRDCVRNDFSLDITSCLMGRPDMPTIAGKIIVHTTAFPDADNPFPVETLLAETVEWSLKGNYILARSSSQISWELLVHVIHPVDTVMPVLPEPSNLPTIIIFMPFLAVGGAERLVLQLIRHLQDRVRFVVVTIEGMDAALGTTADAFHQTVPFVYTAADSLPPPLYFSFLSYLIEHFQADTFYIANGSNLLYDALGTLRQHYPGLRIVDQVYDHQFGWINRYDQTVVTAIDAYISANPNITRAYVEHGARPERIYFVEHAINMEDVNPADYPVERCIQIKQKLGLPVEKKLVTFCARIHPQKRPLDFIELARRFTGEEGIHFLMVGDGPLASAVEEQVVRTGLKNFTRCKFYTPISDIYAITDVMVLPSEYEAMPLVILETLAMGKPVVATDVGHIRDVVEITHGGVVVPNIGDVAALRMGVLQALREPVDSTTMRQIIDQRFGISHIARQYLMVWLGESHA